MDIVELSEVSWSCCWLSSTNIRLGLRLVKELDLQLILGMIERRMNRLSAYDNCMGGGVGGSNPPKPQI